jgi:TonB family protein
MQVRIWIDASGAVTQSRIAVSSGDPRIDSAILNEVLPQVHLSPPPPSDMPMPIVTSFNQTAQ